MLDEPSNHLDMDSIDALARALKAFKGGIMIVSHDEQFLGMASLLDSCVQMRYAAKSGFATRRS